MRYMSDEEAIYRDTYQGLFSRKLAKWAVDNMRMRDVSGKMKPLTPRSVEEVEEILKNNGVELPEQLIYTAYYLFMMAIADYPKTLGTDKLKSTFVEETLIDPDGDPSDVLNCFQAKMCNAGVPIMWERFL